QLSAEARPIIAAFGRTRDGYTPSAQEEFAAEAAWAARSVRAAGEVARAVQEKSPGRAREVLATCAAALQQAKALETSGEEWVEAGELRWGPELEGGGWAARLLIEVDRFEEAAGFAANMASSLEAEAARLGQAEDLRRFREQCSYLAALARVARQTNSK